MYMANLIIIEIIRDPEKVSIKDTGNITDMITEHVSTNDVIINWCNDFYQGI